MIVGVGVDLEQVERLREVVARTPDFLNRVFSEDERAAFEQKSDKQKYPFLATRWAAKEAVYKALSGEIDAFDLRDIQIANLASGKPVVSLQGTAAARAELLKIKRIEISLSHTAEQAVAFVVAEG